MTAVIAKRTLIISRSNIIASHGRETVFAKAGAVQCAQVESTHSQVIELRLS
jgi:hypothetical protein